MAQSAPQQESAYQQNQARQTQAIGGTATARETQVVTQFNRAVETANLLNERIQILEERLSSVLRDPGPAGQSQLKKEGDLVRHAEAISGFADMVQNGVFRIDDILSRLEI